MEGWHLLSVMEWHQEIYECLPFGLCHVVTITYKSHGIYPFYETMNEDENCIEKEPSKVLETKVPGGWHRVPRLGFCPARFYSCLSLIYSYFIGKDICILCHCMLGRYNLIFAFTQCHSQDLAFSFWRNFGHWNSVGTVLQCEDLWSGLNMFC